MGRFKKDFDKPWSTTLEQYSSLKQYCMRTIRSTTGFPKVGQVAPFGVMNSKGATGGHKVII